jgi:ATP-dependent DNA ligase
MLDSSDLRQLPLVDRKQALKQLIENRDPVRYCDHVADYGRSFFELVRNAGLAGIVAKRRESIYSGTLTTDWLKVKCLRKHDFVVDGWLPDDAKRGARALLLGEFFSEALHYVGTVEDGFDRRRLHQIVLDLKPRKTRPFADSIQDPNARFASRRFGYPSSSRSSVTMDTCGGQRLTVPNTWVPPAEGHKIGIVDRVTL